jgi:hypothetical protein
MSTFHQISSAEKITHVNAFLFPATCKEYHVHLIILDLNICKL